MQRRAAINNRVGILGALNPSGSITRKRGTNVTWDNSTRSKRGREEDDETLVMPQPNPISMVIPEEEKEESRFKPDITETRPDLKGDLGETEIYQPPSYKPMSQSSDLGLSPSSAEPPAPTLQPSLLSEEVVRMSDEDSPFTPKLSEILTPTRASSSSTTAEDLKSSTMGSSIPANIVRIGDNIFEVLYNAKFNKFREREIVRIRSYNITDEKIRHFFCYRSQSELGMWRLASQVRGMKPGPYQFQLDKFQFNGASEPIKYLSNYNYTYSYTSKPSSSTYNIAQFKYGNQMSTVKNNLNYYYGDYVQTTAVYIPLQCYINEVLSSLPSFHETTEEPSQSILFIEQRLLRLDESQMPSTLVKVEYTEGKVKVSGLTMAPIENTNNQDELTPPFKIIQKHYVPNPNGTTTVKTMSATHDPRSKEIFSDEREMRFGGSEELKPFRYLNRAYNSAERNFNEERFNHFKADTDLLKKDFTFVCVQQYCPWDFIFEKSIRFVGNIYKLIFKNKKDISKKYAIYYAKGKLVNCIDTTQPHSITEVESVNLVCKEYDIYAPITLVPIWDSDGINGDRCNCYGLYTNYIPCGRLVGKIFDYHINVDLPSKRPCSKKYSYYGMEYNDIFPYCYEQYFNDDPTLTCKNVSKLPEDVPAVIDEDVPTDVEEETPTQEEPTQELLEKLSQLSDDTVSEEDYAKSLEEAECVAKTNEEKERKKEMGGGRRKTIGKRNRKRKTLKKRRNKNNKSKRRTCKNRRTSRKVIRK